MIKMVDIPKNDAKKETYKQKIISHIIPTIVAIGISYFNLALFNLYRQKDFGSVENPKYSISINYNQDKTPAFICKKHSKKEKCDIETKKDIQKIDPNKITFLSDPFNDINDGGINDNNYHNSFIRDHNYPYKNKDEVRLAKEIFKSLTKKEFSDLVKIVKEKNIHSNQDTPNSTAYYNYGERKIAYEDINQLENFESITHEMGHSIAQHLEENYIIINDKTINTLEEACAYAFDNASLYQFANDKKIYETALTLKSKFNYDISYMTKEYYNGKDDKSRHNEGAALFLATYEVLKDPYKTYNYLATLKGSNLENLDPRIKVRMEQNKKLYKNNH